MDLLIPAENERQNRWMAKWVLAEFAVGALLLVCFLFAAGCATKHYGRQDGLTDTEIASLTCREVSIEIARSEGFLARVYKESGFSPASVLSFMGDFGVGNVMEKRAAMHSGRERLEKLRALKLSKCRE